jgi:hypothetical protein
MDESAADLTVTVEDEEYQAEAVVDFNDDGVQDTAMVETDDGAIAFTDTDDDGRADLMTQLDADGDVVAQARFDESTGQWVHIDADQAFHTGTGSMTVDSPEGETVVGAPTHDTDHDGRADSVVVQAPDGDTMIFTDADGDGDADYTTEITGDGRVTVAEHTGDGEWTEIEYGELDGAPDSAPEAGGDNRHAESGTVAEEGSWSATQPDSDMVRIDPSTGDWVHG